MLRDLFFLQRRAVTVAGGEKVNGFLAHDEFTASLLIAQSNQPLCTTKYSWGGFYLKNCALGKTF